MIINTIDGQEIDTDKLNDLDALVYEKLAEDMNFWAQYGLRFYTLVMFGDEQQRMTASFNAQDQDVIGIITWFKREIERRTENRLTLSIHEKQQPDDDYGKFPDEY